LLANHLCHTLTLECWNPVPTSSISNSSPHTSSLITLTTLPLTTGPFHWHFNYAHVLLMDQIDKNSDYRTKARKQYQLLSTTTTLLSMEFTLILMCLCITRIKINSLLLKCVALLNKLIRKVKECSITIEKMWRKMD
jgi:hypothetical protein